MSDIFGEDYIDSSETPSKPVNSVVKELQDFHNDFKDLHEQSSTNNSQVTVTFSGPARSESRLKRKDYDVIVSESFSGGDSSSSTGSTFTDYQNTESHQNGDVVITRHVTAHEGPHIIHATNNQHQVINSVSQQQQQVQQGEQSSYGIASYVSIDLLFRVSSQMRVLYIHILTRKKMHIE